ncbi:MAG TPA: hypothetical protein K8V15_04470 [Tessaracoccus flavescens]|uniref:Uncharacterized protein n=1 Tax=Tessaracoccus flavescens TaxID=399497 RepID=A0A921EPB9_9ACTN|nr:hypothetical protein [Tessaracoccus flavescens]
MAWTVLESWSTPPSLTTTSSGSEGSDDGAPAEPSVVATGAAVSGAAGSR